MTNIQGLVVDLSPEALIAEIERELDYRKKVYARLISQKKMSKDQANRQFLQLQCCIAYIEFFKNAFQTFPSFKGSTFQYFLNEVKTDIEKDNFNETAKQVSKSLITALVSSIELMEVYSDNSDRNFSN